MELRADTKALQQHSNVTCVLLLFSLNKWDTNAFPRAGLDRHRLAVERRQGTWQRSSRSSVTHWKTPP
jgi:hypothetical protein